MIRNLIGRGVGFTPGGIGWIVRLGLSPGGSGPRPEAPGVFTWEDFHVNKVFTGYYAQTELANLIASAPVATGPLNGAKVGLFQGAPVLSSTMTIAQLTAAGILPTYTGYATKTITWDASVVRGPGGLYCVQGTVSSPFSPTDAVTPNTITGLYVCDSISAHVLWAELFDVPFNFLDAFSFLAPTILSGGAPTGDTDILGGS